MAFTTIFFFDSVYDKGTISTDPRQIGTGVGTENPLLATDWRDYTRWRPVTFRPPGLSEVRIASTLNEFIVPDYAIINAGSVVENDDRALTISVVMNNRAFLDADRNDPKAQQIIRLSSTHQFAPNFHIFEFDDTFTFPDGFDQFTIRLDAQFSNDLFVTHVAIGNRMLITSDDATLSTDMSAPKYAIQRTIYDQTNQRNTWAGRRTRTAPLSFNMTYRNLSESWIDANWQRLYDNVSERPFYMFWDWEGHRDQLFYCWIDPQSIEDIRPRFETPLLMSFSLPIMARPV